MSARKIRRPRVVTSPDEAQTQNDMVEYACHEFDAYSQMLTVVSAALREVVKDGATRIGNKNDPIEFDANDRSGVVIVLRHEYVYFKFGDRLAAQLEEFFTVSWAGIGMNGMNSDVSDEFLILVTF